MANPLDTDAGSELFSSYEAELKLVQADLNQKLDQVTELAGEPRKSAIRLAERTLDEANELLGQMRIEKQNIPSATRSKINQRFRNYESDIDAHKRKLKSLADDRKALFGNRYLDNPDGQDQQLEQRQQLLSGTERLDRSSQRLRESQRIANETEGIGRDTLADLQLQRETIQHTRMNLLESEGYVDKSVKTLRGMARRMATNRIITSRSSARKLYEPPILNRHCFAQMPAMFPDLKAIIPASDDRVYVIEVAFYCEEKAELARPVKIGVARTQDMARELAKHIIDEYEGDIDDITEYPINERSVEIESWVVQNGARLHVRVHIEQAPFWDFEGSTIGSKWQEGDCRDGYRSEKSEA
ncbi:MAG: hypothetical protein Q9190_002987 [Brigantiaea leucoxantha]